MLLLQPPLSAYPLDKPVLEQGTCSAHLPPAFLCYSLPLGFIFTPWYLCWWLRLTVTMKQAGAVVHEHPQEMDNQPSQLSNQTS